MPDVFYAVSERVATITLNRPERMNAIGGTLRADLIDALERARHDPEAVVVVLTGAGRAFCAGGDVKEQAGRVSSSPVEHQRRLREGAHVIIHALHRFPKPVICVVNGDAVGAGCSIALACDLRIAAASARFGLVFVRRGLVADWGSSYTLPRLVGMAKAMELCLTGRLVDAAEAERIGMVNRTVPDERLKEEAMQLAGSIAAGPPLALAMTKEVLLRGVDATLEEALESETYSQAIAYGTDDHREGVQAFLEKRRPVFRGR
jgi:2-(1,2-epoxy-1,2-dihydrophenyl)acetyl-CoA isomerase